MRQLGFIYMATMPGGRSDSYHQAFLDCSPAFPTSLHSLPKVLQPTEMAPVACLTQLNPQPNHRHPQASASRLARAL